MLPGPVVLRHRRRETHDTFTLTFDLPGRAHGMPFAPGQFTMLYLFGAGEVPVSISGDPAAPARLVHTIRAVGSVTQPLLALRRGALLGVRGPYGRGWPVAAARGCDILIVAGGLGLAPLRPLVYHPLGRRGDYGHISIVYGARSPADILFRRELERWGGRFDVDVDVIVDHATDTWHGDVGVVTRLLETTRCAPASTQAMVCGPEIMMRFAIRALNDLGIGDERIHVSMERNMQCAIGLCGHCQYGPTFVCRDGPVFRYDHVRHLFGVREL